MEKILSDRKHDHLHLTNKAQVDAALNDQRFNYEPLFSAHPDNCDLSIKFGPWKLKAPIWISSMTGGTKEAVRINENLARVAGEFGLGMGLGSCRPLLNSDNSLKEYQIKHLMGDFPLLANFGIAQIEEVLLRNRIDDLKKIIDKLEVDGMIVHVNPLQEWFQKEGDCFKRAPIDVIDELLKKIECPLIVKEVGQGFGPDSLLALMQRPLAAIEFGAFGGTNFSKLEVLRNHDQGMDPLVNIGHSASEMVEIINGYNAFCGIGPFHCGQCRIIS